MPAASSPAKNCSGRAMPQKAMTGPDDLRDFHAAVETPDRAGPAPCAKFGFEIGIVCRDGEDVCPAGRLQCLAQIAGGQQVIVPVLATDEQNVDIAVELAMLKAVVEDVYERSFVLARVGFGEHPGIVALGGDIDRHAGLARDQQRLVAELVRRAVEVDAEWNRGAAAIAARKHVDLESCDRKQARKRDGERCLAEPPVERLPMLITG